MKRRRGELRLSQRQAAMLADVSPTTWTALEKHHQPLAPLTVAGLTKALRWTPDSVERILDGGEPEELPVDEHEDNRPATSGEVKAIAAAVGEVSGRVADLSRVVEQIAGLVRERQTPGRSATPDSPPQGAPRS